MSSTRSNTGFASTNPYGYLVAATGVGISSSFGADIRILIGEISFNLSELLEVLLEEAKLTPEMLKLAIELRKENANKKDDAKE